MQRRFPVGIADPNRTLQSKSLPSEARVNQRQQVVTIAAVERGVRRLDHA